MKWSDHAWQSIEGVYAEIIKLPFLQELMDGSLAKEKFEFYLFQDSLYLAEFGRVMCGIATKLENAEYREAFLSFAGDTLDVEKALHQFYLQDVKKDLELSPTCLLYTSYLHKQLSVGSVQEAAAAVLPCFWIYKKVGDYILEHQIKGENQYQNWIDTYGGEDFSKAVEKAISICNALAESASEELQVKMTDAFVKASKMEWMFWQSAYELEAWRV